MSDPVRYMTPSEVAEQLRVTPKTVKNWRYLDEPYGPPFVYIGGRVLYPYELFNKWCEETNQAALK